MNWRRLHLYSFNATRFETSTAAPSSACLLLLGTWKIRKDDHSHQPPKAAIIMTFTILLIYFILVPPSDHSQTCFSVLTLLLNRIYHTPIMQKKIYADSIVGRLSFRAYLYPLIWWPLSLGRLLYFGLYIVSSNGPAIVLFHYLLVR